MVLYGEGTMHLFWRDQSCGNALKEKPIAGFVPFHSFTLACSKALRAPGWPASAADLLGVARNALEACVDLVVCVNFAI